MKQHAVRFALVAALSIFTLFATPITAGEAKLPTDVDDVDPTGAAQKSAAPDSPSGEAKPPVLPPKWAFGVLYACYWDQQKVLETADRLRKDYNGDLLWIDSSWLWSEYNRADRYTCFEFDTNQFSDAKGMIKKLRANHFNFGVWQWPYIDVSITNLFQEGEKNHYFITDKIGGTGKVVNGGGWHGVKFTGQIDLTNPKAVEWWKKLHQPLLDMGVNFFKIDTYSTIPPARSGNPPGVTFDGTGSDNLRRLYHKTYYELTEKASGGRGFYLAHRTATPENDQYPGMWTGDTKTSWAGFVDDMKRGAAMNTPRTAAYWGSDTGGYNNDVPGDELYIRWLQYGCFLPLTEFFSAKQTKGRFPWLFGEEAQRNFKFYTKLRYRLLPFRYSNAQAAYHEKPAKYPVHFVPGRQDEIILGNGDTEILVAPIHDEGAVTGEAHLPAGKAWINYWTGEVYPGGSTPSVDAPLDHVPIFVKAGSVIPMGPDLSYVDEKPASPLTLDIYPSGKSTYTLYEDDGQSGEYKQGKFSRTQFTCDAAGNQATVEVGAAQGDYRGKLSNRVYILKFNHKSPSLRDVSRNNSPLRKVASMEAFDSADAGWFNDVEGSTVWVKFATRTSAANKIVLSGLDFEK